MKFNITGVPLGDQNNEFRTLWIQHTMVENQHLYKHSHRAALRHQDVYRLSTAQMLVIDIYTGNEEPYGEDEDLWGHDVEVELGVNLELEALFRARGTALAEMLSRRL